MYSPSTLGSCEAASNVSTILYSPYELYSLNIGRSKLEKGLSVDLSTIGLSNLKTRTVFSLISIGLSEEEETAIDTIISMPIKKSKIKPIIDPRIEARRFLKNFIFCCLVQKSISVIHIGITFVLKITKCKIKK